MCVSMWVQVQKNTATLRLSNEGVAPVAFSVCRAGDESTRDSEAGVPTWLEVYPLDGILASQVRPLNWLTPPSTSH